MNNFDYDQGFGFFHAKPMVCVGFLKIGEQNFLPCFKKPSRFHLFTMRIAFGWTWEDSEKSNEN
jgi:hypothetical protein